MSNPIRFGVIGCGGAAWVGHLPWIWEHPAAELTAVCDRNPDAAARAADRYSVPFRFSEPRQLLAGADIDAVCICTPPSTHAEIAVAAARAGKHILLEKPMSRTVSECDRILLAVTNAGVQLMLGHEKRFSVACQKINAIIRSGALGEVFHLIVHWGSAVKLAPERLIPEGYRESYEWRWKDNDGLGGILQDHLPHYVDLWRWWTGSEVATVCAEVQNVARFYLDRPDIGRWEDFGTVLMRFQNGATAAFETGTVGRGLSPVLHLGSGLGEWSEFGYVYGTKGQIAFDFPPWDSPENGRVMVWSLADQHPDDRGWYQVEMPDPRRCPGGPLSPATNEGYMFRRQLDAFVRSIQERTTPPVTGGDGRATLAVVEAVYESQRRGEKTRVKP